MLRNHSTNCRARPLAMLAMFVVAASTTLAGCEPPAVVEEEVDDAQVEDQAETSSPDSAPSPDQVDAGAADQGPLPLNCPGGPGCACKAADDCDSSQCLETPEGMRCAAQCVDKCQGAFICVGVSSGGSDTVYVCVPAVGRLCDPCEASKDCTVPGHGGAACVDFGPDGGFCGIACDLDASCPNGYACQEMLSTEGQPTKQCVRKPAEGSEAKYGTCECSATAITKGLKTDCYIVSKGPDGNPVGKCEGVRKCEAGGLTACQAPEPVPELCDGLDNDCNGATDEKTCEDDNPCTEDNCDPALAIDDAEGCTHKPLDKPCDADGTVCTENDNCVDGMCIAGSKKICKDDNPCTDDSCDPKEGCVFKQVEGAPCDDGNPCTANDACAGGQCVKGPPKDCDPGNSCVVGTCNPNAGDCVFADKQNGLGCDDNHACTTLDTCKDGACKGKLIVCDDNNPCTDDGCDPKKGCQNMNNAANCDDQSACTKNDKCVVGVCKGTPIDCDDNNPCTTDACGADAGCKSTWNTAPCDADGDACTVGDNCSEGACIPGKPKTCQDDSPCTIDSCDKQKGNCVYSGASKEGLDCDADDSICTVGDKCQQGLCVAGQKKNCNDGNICTDDQCHPSKGCQNVANVEKCNADDNACTADDACVDGGCKVGKDKDCDDKNGCTTDACDVKTGLCGHDGSAHEGVSCDADGSECTENDACKAGKCTAGKPKACEDGNPCTDDKCMTGKGCLFQNNNDPCDDGQKCTVGDKCTGGKCISGTAKACDDKNVCTSDACDTQTGACSYSGVPFEASPCDADGSVCTQGDKCASGQCVPGASLKCDDGNPCTADACDKQQGCMHVPNNEKCDDGDACTELDVCKNEVCTATPKSCDDGNACTTDSCDKKKGCDHVADLNNKLCGTGKVCMGETCTATKCGDGMVHAAVEACDGPNLQGKNCDMVLGNGSWGTLACASSCLSYDTSKCTDLSWMDRTDDCEGFRQSSMHSDVRFAVAKDNVWDPTKTYPCPQGYVWMSTDEAKKIFTGGGQTFTYYGLCGWYAGQYKGKERKYFRFSDSAQTLAFKHSYYYEGTEVAFGKFTEYFAGVVCRKQ